MSKGRLEAFTDGVMAVLITIMVLEMKAPQGTDWGALQETAPLFLVYVLSFVYLGIYWNNHHHMLHATQRITGAVLWANLHLLFWLSLVPFTTAWMGEHHYAAIPTATYGAVMFCAGVAYYILQGTLVRAQGPHSTLAAAIGRDLKGKLSPVLYAIAILLAFQHQLLAEGVYVLVALVWLIPDPRIESRVNERRPV